MLFALGFVFMFTVGGFSIHLALPLKTTICWKLLTIMLLIFYFLITVKTHIFEQSAGNQAIVYFSNSILVGTSETVRSTHIILWEDTVRVIKYSLIYLYDASQHNLNYTVIRSYSSLTSNSGLWQNTKNLEEKVYNSLKEDRVQILNYQSDKSGVYCLINNIIGHAYVGSSINITSRMRLIIVFSFSSLKKMKQT